METSLQQQRDLERGQKATGKKAKTGDGPDGGVSDPIGTDAEPATPGEGATAGEPDDVDMKSAEEAKATVAREVQEAAAAGIAADAAAEPQKRGSRGSR